ncbi:hypothetical protein HN014_15490 [Aquimarina sp. TRL1]|uniref:hypothetical protein n=1 Tax=Aquimarina sp. (strain TRL1) TaxID=2736252 RepID=UPI00158E5787|nr:hypothetical protein [Aquimarina sp. TRL1]QKX06254.1 hypothetical protein HN014_15490 [Aquimarina sp. TRL1]
MKNKKQHTNTSPFKVPKNYFEEFDTKLFDAIEHQQSNEIPIDLSTGFKTPETYFDTLENKILNTVTATPKKTKVISLFSKRKIFLFSSIAAMIALLITIYTNHNTEETINSLDIADIQNYLLEDVIDISYTDIAEMIDDTDEISFIEELQINDESLIEYLSEEELDDDNIYLD